MPFLDRNMSAMKAFSLLILLSRLAGLHAEVLRLSDDDFWDRTIGKNVFLFFTAEWCSHCQEISPDWARLATDHANNPDLVIAEVSCEDSPDLCEEFDVDFLPAFLYGDPQHVETYSSDEADYHSLKKFTEETLLELYCSIHNLEACDEDEIAVIRQLREKPLADLREVAREVEEGAAEADAIFQAEVEEIQKRYNEIVKEFNDKVDELREASNYKLVSAVVQEKEEADMNGEL